MTSYIRQKTSIEPRTTIYGKMKIPKPYNIPHLQDIPIQIIEHKFAITIDVDGVPVKGKFSNLDRLADRVNTNIPDLTLESAVIIILFFVKKSIHV